MSFQVVICCCVSIGQIAPILQGFRMIIASQIEAQESFAVLPANEQLLQMVGVECLESVPRRGSLVGMGERAIYRRGVNRR